jgi:hypothetical protein
MAGEWQARLAAVSRIISSAKSDQLAVVTVILLPHVSSAGDSIENRKGLSKEMF